MSAATPEPLRSACVGETEAIGRALGAALQPGDVISVNGPLGAGKTCLARGIVAGAGGDPRTVRSPTFVLHQPHAGGRLVVHHLDLYRLGDGAALDVFDLDSALEDGAAVIEWGELADLSAYAVADIAIDSDPASPDQRVIRLAGGAPAHLADSWSALTGAADRR